MKEILKDEFDIEEANSGREALQVLRKESFYLVITNLRIPRMDSFELTNLIKDQYPELPVILVSASLGALSQKRAYEKYVKACMAKPIDANKLTDTVKSVLGKSFGNKNT